MNAVAEVREPTDSFRFETERSYLTHEHVCVNSYDARCDVRLSNSISTIQFRNQSQAAAKSLLLEKNEGERRIWREPPPGDFVLKVKSNQTPLSFRAVHSLQYRRRGTGLLAGNPSGTPFRAMSYVDFVTPMLRSKIVCLGARQKHPNKARVYSRDSMKDA